MPGVELEFPVVLMTVLLELEERTRPLDELDIPAELIIVLLEFE